MEVLYIIASALGFCLLWLSVKSLLYPKPIPGIPYNQESAERLHGDLPRIKDSYESSGEWTLPLARRGTSRYGSPIQQIFMSPLQKPLIVIDDPREVTDILLRRNKEFDKSTSVGVWQTVLPYSTIAQRSTPEWKAQRKTWSDTMHPDFLKRVVAGNIYKAAIDLTKLWEQRVLQSKQGGPVNVQADFSYAALDAIWVAAFGEHLELVKTQAEMLRTGEQIDTKGLEMHSTVQYLNRMVDTWRGSLWPAFSQWKVKRSPGYRNYMRNKDREVDRLLLAASARFRRLLEGTASGDTAEGEEHDTCAMDLVLRRSMLAAQKAGKPFQDPTKDARMRDELVLFVYAGHDTTSTTLQWFVKFMTNNQEAQTKLRSALQSALQNSPSSLLPDVTSILDADIPYLNATIEETLRGATTASRTSRTATTDAVILGHKVPKGTDIWGTLSVKWLPSPSPEDLRSLSSRAAGEKSGDWTHLPNAQDLDKFAPERWFRLDADGKEVFDATVLPQNSFGGGQRGCFGRRLAMMELRIMITLVTLSFKFLPIPGELNSYQVTEAVLRTPRQCYLQLEKV